MSANWQKIQSGMNVSGKLIGLLALASEADGKDMLGKKMHAALSLASRLQRIEDYLETVAIKVNDLDEKFTSYGPLEGNPAWLESRKEAAEHAKSLAALREVAAALKVEVPGASGPASGPGAASAGGAGAGTGTGTGIDSIEVQLAELRQFRGES